MNTIFEVEAELLLGDRAVTVFLGAKDGLLVGRLEVGGRSFALRGRSNRLVAVYRARGEQGEEIDVEKDLVRPVFGELPVPKGLKIGLKEALFAYDKPDKPAEEQRFLFSVTTAIDRFGLSKLPVVGEHLPEGVGIEGLQVLVVKGTFDEKTVEALNQLAEGGGLPGIALEEGFLIAAKVSLGEEGPQILAFPIGGGAASRGREVLGDGGEKPEKKGWLPKTLGPVTLRKLTPGYADGKVQIGVDLAFTFSGLTLSLEGLAVGFPLKYPPEAPSFALAGLGLAYDGGGRVAVSGSLAKLKVGYAGSAVIETEAFTLSALGAFDPDEGSLFLYGVLDKPIGGPAFFFVTGLAAGFGVNRRLNLPELDGVESFPLVRAALPGSVKQEPGEMLGALQKYLPASSGDAFLAVGVRFTSFKIIESFALLTVAFGRRFEVGVLGLSTLEAPPETKPPLARVQIALVGRFRPEEGDLKVDGKILPGSYVFAPACELSGDFAFYSWFTGDHAGDFVLTAGGYHPAFRPPSHYPQKLSRLALNWPVDGNLTVRGEAYFALTASAMMAGGRLEAVWRKGEFRAWFSVGADFLVAWKPYHYDARAYVSIGASYRFKVLGVSKTLSVDVGADLHLWGPPFSGTARVKLKVVTVTIRFGHRAPAVPPPISWEDFRGSFLPAGAGGSLRGGEDGVCTLAVRSGLIEHLEKEDVWRVNPESFSVTAETAVPFTKTNDDERYLVDGEPSARPGIRPMRASELESTFSVEIEKEGRKDVEKKFRFAPIRKKVPAALWGPPEDPPALNGERFLENALAGIEIRPEPPQEPKETASIPCGVLEHSPTAHPLLYAWLAFTSPAPGGVDREKIEITPKGRELAAALGLPP